MVETQGEVIDFGEVGLTPPPLLPVPERIALGTHKLRIWVSVIALAAFLLVNVLVLLGLHEALTFDFKMLAAPGSHYERFVNTTVIGSLLGATTVQLGAVMFAIVKFLFPSR